MSPDDGSDHGDGPGLSPADDARIRRLLAEARHTEPMPGDVVARLDRVLAGLAEERKERLAPVVELASRRRRTAASLLVAAAAVVVVGVGISRVLPDNGVVSSGGDAQTSTQEDAAGGSANAPEPSRNGSQSAVAPPEAAPGQRPVVRIRSAHFGPDVRRARTTASKSSPQAFVAFPPADGCLTVDPGPGSLLPATYDEAPAYLVLRPPAGDTQVVDLYLCGDTAPRRSITLTTP